MNFWLGAAIILLAGLFVCGVMCMKSNLMNRLTALQLSNVISSVIILLLAEGFHNDIFFDSALCLVIISFAGTLIYIRFIEKWL